MGRQLSKIASWLDKIAGFGLVLIMAMIFISVILRAVYKPLMGIDEYTGFLLAIVISFALANCGLKNGHIAVDMVVERLFSPKVQAVIDSITGIISFGFLSMAVWHLGKYAYSMYVGGEVMMTTTMPFYPYIYAVAFGVLSLAVVVLVKFIDSLKSIYSKGKVAKP